MIRVLALALILLAGFPPGRAAADATAPRSASPALVVLLVADQFRYDYLERFAPLYRHGLRRLLNEGVNFTHADHAHALTETCPGHAALATGMHPAHSGIVENAWVDRASGKEVYCVDDPQFKQSPHQLAVESIGDWLRNQDPAARVFAASGKDRAAIMLGGQHPSGVWWYDGATGGFVSSAYYPPSPDWVEGFNRAQDATRWFGENWRALPVPADLAAAAQVVTLDHSLFGDDFPHAVGQAEVVPSSAFYKAFYESPFLDALLDAFVARLIDEEKPGTRGHTDLLAISYSALDLVGHHYGPNSREVMDTLLRLDTLIGDLLDRLDRLVGKGRTLVLFSSDHGVEPLPEYQRLHGIAARRADAEDVACLQSTRAYLRDHFQGHDIFRSGLLLDDKVVAALGVSRKALDQTVRDRLESCAAVDRVWTRTELLADGGGDQPYFTAWRNSLYPDRGDDYFIQYRENFQLHGTGTGHGTPYAYDTHVPLIFWGGKLRPGAIDAPVATVDAAPTLAALAGIRTPKDLDGQDRSGLIRR